MQKSEKRRQARMKNEERKMQLEEAEKQRRVLLEKQLRTAEKPRAALPEMGHFVQPQRTSTETSGSRKRRRL